MSIWSIFLIPSTSMDLLLIKELNESAVKIFSLEATSSPFKSEVELVSAYPSVLAFDKESLYSNLSLSMEDKT